MTPAKREFPAPGVVEDAISVTELAGRLRSQLRDEYSRLMVVGELSGVRRPASGHVYLTLKDEGAQISAVIWRSQARSLEFDLEEGLEVVAEGGLDLYPPRGQVQFVVRRLRPRGLGPLQLAFRQLFDRLKKEGLFDPNRKRVLPRYPTAVGVVTSPTGAALIDILNVMTRRWPLADITVFPSRVQGEGSASEIAEAIEKANRLRPDLDLLIVGRRGGSLEDLWAFNEEIVARAIEGSLLPIVSAVGHEIDVTISDLVADVRAQTPTEAADLAVPSRSEVIASLRENRGRMIAALRRRVDLARNRVIGLAGRRVLRDPRFLVQDRARSVDDLAGALRRVIDGISEGLRHHLRALQGRLEAMDPTAVLARGYSVTTFSGRIVRHSDQVQPGDSIRTRVAGGEFESKVTE